MNILPSTLVDTATRLAVTAHEGQKRKEGGVPYIMHPVMVALILAKHDFSDVVIAAALTHDVPEDTKVTLEELREALGDEVADIVASVTNDDSLSWKDKKLKYIESVRAGSEGAKAVATADKIHNAQSLIRNHERAGTKVWAHFNTGRDEKIWFEDAMLAMLQETWQHPLVDEYAVLVARMNALD
jgi:(p)ppGpp synthase/HD superfamily hydrolase